MPAAIASPGSAPPDDPEAHMLGTMNAEAVCRALLDGITEHAVAAIDRDGRVVIWNAGAERLTGFARHEAVGQWIDALEAFDDAARAHVRTAITTTMATGAAEYEGWRVRRDGSRYWAHTRLTPVLDAQSQLAGIALVMRDITERQAGSDAIARSRALFADRERYLQAVLDTQPECVMVVTPDGALLDMNAAGLATFEAGSLAQLRGSRMRGLVAEGHRDAFDALHAGALDGATGTLEFEIIGLRGRACWLESRTVPLRDGPGAVVAVLSVARDVSARREARALRRSEELFHGVVSLASDAIVTVDEHRCIVLFNRAAEEAFGYTAGEMLGQSLDRLLPPHVLDPDAGEAPAPAVVDAQALSHGTAERREVYGRRKSGEHFPAEVAVSRSSVGGQLRHTAIVRDVSEQRRLAAALQAVADELARSNAELEQFAYVASHDLQEPLRMVSSYTQLLAQRYQGQLDERADKYIHYAVDGAQRMQVLITDLLALSRLGTHGNPPALVAVGDVVARALVTLGDVVRGSGAHVDVGALPTIMGDAGQIAQLFQNLIGNALKFARPGEAPEVSVTAVRAADRTDAERWWTFAVRDAGIGIDSRHAIRIFGMFQRLHTREQFPGTGIGLAICKKIVERHGGRIWVDSTPGEGATFHFTLPETR